MDPELRRLYDGVQAHLQTLRDLQAKKTKFIESRHQLGAQKNENDLVKQELHALEPTAVVYKLIGPALISQDASDAKTIVEKRIEFINGETRRVESTIEEIEKREEEVRTAIAALQKSMQERSQALAQRAGGNAQ